MCLRICATCCVVADSAQNTNAVVFMCAPRSLPLGGPLARVFVAYHLLSQRRCVYTLSGWLLSEAAFARVCAAHECTTPRLQQVMRSSFPHMTPISVLFRRAHNVPHCNLSSRSKHVLTSAQPLLQIFSEAQDLMPGGVNSPVRAFKSVGGQPIVFDSVKGACVTDADGNEYIDYVGTWGPAIVGHANEEVLDAIKAQLDKGTSYGAPCELENVMAKMVIDRVPSVERVRFCSSGTEACISALRLMRAYTGREKLIKFVGCFHGHGDAFLVQAGSGVATLGLPDSPGVPKGSTAGTLCATYNDLESVKAIFEANKGEIAGLMLEPVVGNSGYIAPTQEFLEGLREMCTAEGAVLCFDEVRRGRDTAVHYSAAVARDIPIRVACVLRRSVLATRACCRGVSATLC